MSISEWIIIPRNFRHTYDMAHTFPVMRGTMTLRYIVAIATVIAFTAFIPAQSTAKGKKGKLNETISVTLHDPTGQSGPDYFDSGLNALFTVDHEATVLCHGVMDAHVEEGDVVIGIFVDGQEDPDPMTWPNFGQHKAFLRSFTVPAGTHSVSVRVKDSENPPGGQPFAGVGERRMVVQVF